MKVRAIKGCHRNLTAGKVYDVVSISEGGGYWRVVDDNGNTDGFREANFEVVEGEPKIEVGSEWVNSHGATLTVEYVGKHCAVCTWNETGKEFASPIKNHTKFYKPKPKTVTMYFYWDNRGILCATEDNNYAHKAFTREIELP